MKPAKGSKEAARSREDQQNTRKVERDAPDRKPDAQMVCPDTVLEMTCKDGVCVLNDNNADSIDLSKRIREIFGFSIPTEYFDVVEVVLDKTKLRLSVTKHCMLTEDALEQGLHLTDTIIAWDGTEVPNRHVLFQRFKEALQAKSKKIKIRLLRLKPKLAMDQKRLPMGLEIPKGMQFEHFVAVMFNVPMLRLSLVVKSYMDKVFVKSAPAGTLAGLAFEQGDAILDVDSQPVANVDSAYRLIMSGLKANGYVTMVVERPVDESTCGFVRVVMQHNQAAPIDVNLDQDVRKICRAQRKVIADAAPPPVLKSILREGRGAENARRIRISSTRQELSIGAHGNPKLLGRVPKQNTALYNSLSTSLRLSEDSLSPTGNSPPETDDSSRQPAAAAPAAAGNGKARADPKRSPLRARTPRQRTGSAEQADRRRSKHSARNASVKRS